MIPVLLVKIALIIMMVRCLYVAISGLNNVHKNWLNILFYLSVGVVAVYFYIIRFGHLF
jgi:hypothetical protein